MASTSVRAVCPSCAHAAAKIAFPFPSPPPQGYIIVLLVCTIGYQDPLMLGVMVTGSNGLHFVSRCIVTTSFAVMMTCFLFIFDSINLGRCAQRPVCSSLFHAWWGARVSLVCWAEIILDSVNLVKCVPVLF